MRAAAAADRAAAAADAAAATAAAAAGRCDARKPCLLGKVGSGASRAPTDEHEDADRDAWSEAGYVHHRCVSGVFVVAPTAHLKKTIDSPRTIEMEAALERPNDRCDNGDECTHDDPTNCTQQA